MRRRNKPACRRKAEGSISHKTKRIRARGALAILHRGHINRLGAYLLDRPPAVGAPLDPTGPEHQKTFTLKR